MDNALLQEAIRQTQIDGVLCFIFFCLLAGGIYIFGRLHVESQDRWFLAAIVLFLVFVGLAAGTSKYFAPLVHLDIPQYFILEGQP